MESLNKTDLIAIRKYSPEDRNFILATWLRGLYYGDTWFKEIPKSVFMEKYHDIIDSLLLRPGVEIKIACLKEDPEVILGYSVSRTIQNGEATVGVLDWIFVKTAWRKIGIAKMLLPSKLNACTHLTKTGLSVMRSKLPNVIFNPFYN